MTTSDFTKVAILVGGLGGWHGCASPAANRPGESSGTADRGTRATSELAAASRPATWKSIAPGRSTTLGVKADGSLWVWGWNGQGGSDRRLEYAAHIDNHRPPVALRPTRVGDANDWASISASDGSFLALKANGTLWGWGDDSEARRRDDDEDEVSERKPAASPPGFPPPHALGTDTDWRQVATASWHSLALRNDGTLWGWGSNRDGELGDGTTEERTAPVRIGLEHWRTVVTAAFRSFGIRQDGTLWVWGSNVRGWGQEPKRTTSPMQVVSEAGWQQLSCSSSHLLAVNADGTLWAYGGNRNGERGVVAAGNGDRYVLTKVGQDHDWVAASAGEELSLAIKRDGSLWAWGANSRGQLGDGTTVDRATPVPVAPATRWRAVYAGEAHVVAEALDGSTWTWGSDMQGQLGDGRTLVTLEPTPVLGGSKWRFIAGYQGSSFALRDDGALWTWGSSKAGELVKSAAAWKALAHYRGGSFIGIQKDGSLWELSWHDGKMERIEKDRWLKAPGGERWARVFANDHGVLAQDEQDGLWYFHRVQENDQRAHTRREVWRPEPLGKSGEWGHAFAEVSPGVVLAQKQDGTFWLFESAWDESKAPVLVDKQVAWEAIAVGESEILLLGKNGQLWRFDGQERERVGVNSEWKTASVSTHHTLAVRKDGSLWSWGQGEAGELGTVYSGEQPTPVRVGKDSDWAEVVAAHDHSLALKRDGSLWAWGNNLNGELGIGPPRYRETPGRLEMP
jgi:alpha-tubulin suppressor-like RCC1 family protein